MTGPNGDPDTIDTPINVRVSIVGDLVLVTFQTKRDLAAGTLYAIPIRGTRQGRAVLLHDQGLPAPEVAPAHRADTPDVAQDCTPAIEAERATFSDGTVATPQDLPFPKGPRIAQADVDAAVARQPLPPPDGPKVMRGFFGSLEITPEQEKWLRGEGGPRGVVTDTDRPDMQAKLVLPNRMRKENKATCMKCGEGVNPNQHEFKRSFAGTCTECGEGMLSPHHVLHTCPPGTPDFPPEPM